MKAGRGGRLERRALVVIALTLIVVRPAASAGTRAQPASPRAAIPPAALARAWDAGHVSPPLPALVRHPEVEARLEALRDSAPAFFSLEEIGRSVEDRTINHLWFGRGDFHVMLWSQMHGDEPTATAALFDLADYLYRGRDEEPARTILGALTLHVIPMLNPDGAERFQRRNAQGIDVNRDALRLQTPEGRALKALRDRLNAGLGFNLHNQGWRTAAGKAGRPASISLLAVAFDEAQSNSAGRTLAKKTCSVIRGALEELVGPQVARYDEEFEVRAFGDNITKWGTPVVLIETGPIGGDRPDADLVRLNFVGLISALDAIATGRVDRADPQRYESLPVNTSDLSYVLVRNATVVPGTGVAPFIADIGVGVARTVRSRDGQLEMRQTLRIDDLGDLRVLSAIEEVDAAGLTVAPLADPTVKEGDEVSLPEKAPAGSRATISVGAPADLMLLKPAAAPGRFVVVRVIRSESVVK